MMLGTVILAAGESARMGRPKMLLPWGETSVLGHHFEVWRAVGAAQVCAVIDPGNEAMRAELGRLGIMARHAIPNLAPARGMFSSIQCASAWPHWGAELTHWAIALGDQPQIQAETLRALWRACVSQAACVWQPSLKGKPRHPVILPRPAFQELANSRARNLREFLGTSQVPRATVELDDPGLAADLDTPEDYEREVSILRGRL